jgi:threonyl-tRNA synthetase
MTGRTIHTGLADHRKLGRELGVFTTDERIGAGLPLWLPNGCIIRHCLESYILDLERQHGYTHVVTPQLGKQQLYEISGHWDHFRDDMFPPMQVGGDKLVLRPMNCPHHMIVFAAGTRSYRDLPLRIAELGTMYRQERSGVLGGLNRVRAMTLNDAHIFCSEDQIAAEVANVLDLMHTAYGALGISEYSLRLSLRSEEAAKYVTDDVLWDRAESTLRRLVQSLDVNFAEAPGEAAFYGPKLDVQVRDYLGREFTLSTVQIDFHLPHRFELGYDDGTGRRRVPVAIHRSIVSTMERMVAHLLEIHQGALPPWLSPTQVAVVPVHEEHDAYAVEVAAILGDAGLRCEARSGAHTLGARIRQARLDRIPYVAVVGARERAERTLSLGTRDGRSLDPLALDDAAEFVSSVVRRREARR